jgi:Flp pilus assembly pilin Flp
MSQIRTTIQDLLDRSIDRTNLSSGQGLADYALIISLIAIVAIIALFMLGGSVSGLLSEVGSNL